MVAHLIGATYVAAAELLRSLRIIVRLISRVSYQFVHVPPVFRIPANDTLVHHLHLLLTAS